MADLNVKLGNLNLRNPIITASGTFGYGIEYSDIVPLEKLGGITVKGVSPFPSHGNPTPRTAEVCSGMLNAIGLQNPGIDKFIEHPDYLPWLRKQNTAVIINIWGKNLEDYALVASRLEAEKQGIAALEINISCPNIKEGGISFGTNPEMAAKVVTEVRKVTSIPLITKLSPNVTDITEIARSVEAAGSDMVSLINTFTAMAIDIQTRRPIIANVTAGLSGPAIKPIAVRMVYDVARAVKIPIIGMGGICSAADAIEFMMAGASAISVGTAIFSDPTCLLKIIDDLENWLDKNNVKSVTEIIGAVRKN